MVSARLLQLSQTMKSAKCKAELRPSFMLDCVSKHASRQRPQDTPLRCAGLSPVLQEGWRILKGSAQMWEFPKIKGTMFWGSA